MALLVRIPVKRCFCFPFNLLQNGTTSAIVSPSPRLPSFFSLFPGTMSQHPDPPPSAPNNNSPSRPDAAICGKKFRLMLSCVEKSGAVAACTEKVNDFLYCERRVFQAAVRKTSANTASASKKPLYTPPPPPPLPVTTAPTANHANDEPQRGPYDFLAEPVKSVERVVRKQFAACASLVETIRRPSYQTQLLQFNRRMLTDMRVTCEIIRAKTVQFVNRLSQSPGDDDGKPGNR